MRSGSRKLAAASALALLSMLLIGGTPAGAQGEILRIQVGAPLFVEPAAKGAPADGMRFLAPPDLAVHQGDTVRFRMAGFHTATLLPANTDVDAWVADNAGDIGKPYSVVGPDPDEGPAAVKFNNALFFPSPIDCGAPADPCAYDGSSVLNSGVLNPANVQGPPLRYSATINAGVGDVVPFVCLIHLNMRGSLTIVGPTEAATTQTEIDAYRDQTVARDARQARRLHRELLGTASSGPGVLDAYAGVDGEGFALNAFYPRRLDLRRGQRVRWHFDRLTFEDHTVTFPRRKALGIANRTFLPTCDPDGDSGTEPDEPGNPDATTIDEVCAGGMEQVEFDVPKRFGPPGGDGVVTSHKDFENSGIRGANIGGTDAYVLRFSERSRGEPFTWICLIHPFMRGKVFVA